ncbi:hypothetical protein HUJ04_009908 [Dendroctonus ponderosae]|nr:hypothetical protein HUJ04_009908 [Dendroctonus ponderosae]
MPKIHELYIKKTGIKNLFLNTFSDCAINPFEVSLHPIIVLSGTSNFLYPIWGEKVLRFKHGEAVDFICPGRTILIGGSETNNSLLSGTCFSDSEFAVGNEIIEWSDLICSSTYWRGIQRTGNTCASDGVELEAGFSVDDGRFLQTLLICFNPTLQVVYYTFINQTASINQQVLGTARPSWLQGSGIYDVGSVTSLYVRANQRATVNGQLGLEANSTKYIQDSTNYYLARGHLTARSDNFYTAQQNATFYMQNIAPQWQTFNGWNWNQIEIDLRDYASENGVDLQVWTGVYGVTTLPHEDSGEPTELYLYYVNETRKAIPVPQVYWKVAYNPLTQRGIALIGVNNPYNSTFSKLCFDVSSRLSWLHCERENQILGFCYACSITTLRYAVNFIPAMDVRGLLL